MSGMDPEIKRTPIRTQYMRRDCTYNPEYLEAERAFARFTPLIESIVRRLRSLCSITASYDIEDLRSIIHTEFLRLHEKYDPSYGVDFPGYIKLNLERRARYYVVRSQKHRGHEVLALESDMYDDDPIEAIPDETAQQDLGRVERIASVPIESIEDETVRDIIYRVLINKEDIHSLARRYNVSPRSMALKIDAAGQYVRQIMQKDGAHEEIKEKGKREAEAGTD